jgi:hypothetical protein
MTSIPIRATDTPIPPGSLPSWEDQIKLLLPVGDKLLKNWARPNMTEEEKQDHYTLGLAMLSNGYLCHVFMDPKRPMFMPLWNIAYNQGGPNPDYTYSWASVDPEGVYRVSGFRGTNRFTELSQMNHRLFHPLDEQRNAKPITNDLDQLTLGDDGSFSVIISAERPAGYEGDWWQLSDETLMIILRRCSTDWRNEIDSRIAIERLDPVETASWTDVSQRWSELPDWITGMIFFMTDLVKWYREHHPTNGLELSKKITQIGGLPNQFYYDGIYQIDDDEALIVELPLPKTCRYWQILVADDRFCTVDWVNRQSSLNDRQARLDADGRLRAVVSKQDPGVPNWLDKEDNAWGILQMRFNKASDAPEAKVTKVKLADVRKHLPAETPVVTPEERKQQLAARREAAQLRTLW